MIANGVDFSFLSANVTNHGRAMIAGSYAL